MVHSAQGAILSLIKPVVFLLPLNTVFAGPSIAFDNNGTPRIPVISPAPKLEGDNFTIADRSSAESFNQIGTYPAQGVVFSNATLANGPNGEIDLYLTLTNDGSPTMDHLRAARWRQSVDAARRNLLIKTVRRSLPVLTCPPKPRIKAGP